MPVSTPPAAIRNYYAEELFSDISHLKEQRSKVQTFRNGTKTQTLLLRWVGKQGLAFKHAARESQTVIIHPGTFYQSTSQWTVSLKGATSL
jgi:hypothetical protein